MAALRRTLRPAIALGCLVASALLVWFAWVKPMLDDPASIPLGKGGYVLEGTDGRPFTQASLRGRPSAVFFGFTHCPEVCPTTLSDIALWQDTMGLTPEDLAVYFVTVDPERDSADLLADYVGWVDGVVGVTGPVAQIEEAKRAFRIFARKIPLSDGEYTMDHTAYVMLFDARGEFFEPVGYQEDLARVTDKLTRLLRADPG